MEEFLLPDKSIKEWAHNGTSMMESVKFCQFAAKWPWLEEYKSVLPRLIEKAFIAALGPDDRSCNPFSAACKLFFGRFCVFEHEILLEILNSLLPEGPKNSSLSLLSSVSATSTSTSTHSPFVQPVDVVWEIFGSCETEIRDRALYHGWIHAFRLQCISADADFLGVSEFSCTSNISQSLLRRSPGSVQRSSAGVGP